MANDGTVRWVCTTDITVTATPVTDTMSFHAQVLMPERRTRDLQVELNQLRAHITTAPPAPTPPAEWHNLYTMHDSGAPCLRCFRNRAQSLVFNRR